MKTMVRNWCTNIVGGVQTVFARWTRVCVHNLESVCLSQPVAPHYYRGRTWSPHDARPALGTKFT